MSILTTSTQQLFTRGRWVFLEFNILANYSIISINAEQRFNTKLAQSVRKSLTVGFFSKKTRLVSFSISKHRHRNFKEVLPWFVHNFILGLGFDELFRNEARYLFLLFCSLLELDWNRKNSSNAEQKSLCQAHKYQRALVYNFGRAKRRSEVIITKTITQREVLK